MRIVAIAVIVCALLAGCGGSDGSNTLKCMQSVQNAFGPDAEVFPLPGEKYRFIVKDDIGIWYVNTLNSGPEVSSQFLVIKDKTK